MYVTDVCEIDSARQHLYRSFYGCRRKRNSDNVVFNSSRRLVIDGRRSRQPRLPQEVQRQGVTTKKQSTKITLVASLISPDDTYDDLYLSNFATLRVKGALTRIEGVGDVQVIGGGTYGIRIWVDPDALKARNLTLEDMLVAIREQNVQVAAGQVGQAPTPKDQGFQFNVSVQGRLSDPEQFGEIIIKTVSDDQSGRRMIRVKDVARVELGAQTYDQWCEIGGQPAASLLVYQLPGANALRVADNVKAAMAELQNKFPKGIEAIIPFDTTTFVEESIYEVYSTLIEAGVLVLVVILIFMQDWRATLIPATTVPVTIILLPQSMERPQGVRAPGRHCC